MQGAARGLRHVYTDVDKKVRRRILRPTERDALMRLGADVATYTEEPIESLMVPDPVTLNARDRIAFALHKMHVGGYRHIPILSEEKLVGVISIRDILNYLTERIGVSTS